MATPRRPSQDQTIHGAKAGTRAISAPTSDDALRMLARLLAQQTARDGLAHQYEPEFAPRQRTERHR